jgi:hypothetical protein
MADLLPSFETLTKLSGWAAAQAAKFPRVWANPTSHFDEVTKEGDPLPASISFFAFVMVVNAVITIPIEASMWDVDPFSPSYMISSTILWVLGVVAFSLGIYIGGRMLGGKADLREAMAAMLFASAFLPLFEVTSYVSRLDSEYRTALINQRLDDPNLLLRPAVLAALVLQTFVLAYIFVKLVPLVKRIQSFGSLRAFTTICVAGAIHQAFTFWIHVPFFRGLIAAAAKH